MVRCGGNQELMGEREALTIIRLESHGSHLGWSLIQKSLTLSIRFVNVDPEPQNGQVTYLRSQSK